MFPDPTTITINSVAKSLARVSVGDQKSTYQNADETFLLEISHQAAGKGRTRSFVRLTQRAVVSNPLDSTNDYDDLVAYIVIDRPAFGFTMVQVEQLVGGLKDFLTNATIDKLYGKES